MSVNRTLIFQINCIIAGEECTSSLDQLYHVCQRLLDLVYLEYSDVYTRLHTVVAAGSPITDKDRYVHVGHCMIIRG